MEKGGQFPPSGAIRGWSHSEWGPTWVSGRDRTDEVFRIADVVGHILSSDWRDQNVQGQFYASHAEKQLIAYFVDRHVFLPGNRGPDDEVERKIMNTREQLTDLCRASVLVKQLYKLEKKRSRLN